METVGSFLKSEREKKKKSLKDISNATKISKTTIEAIEEDRKESLPPPSYVRGFLRIYAKELDLDPDEVIEMHERRLREKKWEPQKEFKGPEPAFIRKNYKYITVGVIFLIFLIFYFVYKGKKPETEDAQQSIMSETATTVPVLVQETAPQDVIEEEVTEEQNFVAVAETDYEDVQDDAPGQKDGFTVRFAAKELTWVRLTVDDKEPFEIMLRDGESYRKAAEESMKVRIGNAGGLSLFFNDIPLGVPGEHGKPLNLQFPDAAEELLDFGF
jgi:cytoskeleton protein RodZ